ncbi:MAG: nitrilase-related carbon-nitrogen hydrolase, partial [Acidobacteriota bacterium]
MKLIHVGAAMLNTIPLAWDHNLDLITTALERARDRRVSLLCLPELCITGYGCEDAFYSPGVQRTALEVLHEIAPRTRGLIATVGLPLAYRKALFDAVAVLVDGHIAGFVAKRHLAGDGIYYEPRWFRPWPAATRVEVDLAADDARADVEGLSGDAASYPLGDLVFTCDGVRIGFEICEDAWVAERPGAALAARGVDVLLNPSASHFAFGKAAIRERFVLEGSRAFGVSYVYANLVGNEAGRAIYDGGALIASAGRMLAAGPRFSYADVRLTTAVIDVDETRMLQTRTSSYMPRIEPDPDGEIEVPFRFPTLRDAAEVETVAAAAPGAPGAPLPADGAPPPVVSPYAHGPRAKEEEFTRAVALGLIDYLRKSRSHGFVVSLSGGADSAATACLVALAVRLGAAELGLQRLLTKIDYIDRLAAAGTPDEVLRHLLICAYQATRNSGPVTRAAAAGLAEALGATHHE